MPPWGMTDTFDLTETYVHLGRGSTVTQLPGFTFSPECLREYKTRFASDGDEGRLVCIVAQDRTWDTWERHPAGEELVVVLTGCIELVQEVDGEERAVVLGPGEAVVNPAGVWHTARVREPGQALFVTPGQGTEGRPVG
jgi:mannose-6-phosphate isomerase-like protein (cupin superfamily)